MTMQEKITRTIAAPEKAISGDEVTGSNYIFTPIIPYTSKERIKAINRRRRAKKRKMGKEQKDYERTIHNCEC